MTWFRDAVADIAAVSAIECSDGVSCTDEQVDLVHGRKYLVDLFYRDAVCNPAQSAGSIEVTFASNYTLLPYFYNPLPGLANRLQENDMLPENINKPSIPTSLG